MVGNNIFELGIKMEEDGYNCYLSANQNINNEEAKRWLKYLAEEEKKHVERIKEIDSALKNTGEWIDIQPKIKEEFIEQIKTIFSEPSEENKQELKNNKDFTEILNTAMKKETESYQFYKNVMENSANSKEEQFCKILMSEENTHYEILQNIEEYLNKGKDWFAREESRVWNWMNV